MSDITVRPIRAADRSWAKNFLIERWGSDRMVAHSAIYYPAELEGFLALQDGEPAGYATYDIVGDSCEIVFIDSGPQHRGIGTALLEAIKRLALERDCNRLWLITTNDNLDALRFYQRRGFHLTALTPNAVDASRLLKPEIPLAGDFGIPLRDELELEMTLAGDVT
jgi:GNAT superfamily N-acetyltransferase